MSDHDGVLPLLLLLLLSVVLCKHPTHTRLLTAVD
jgi:hypothetical protein